MCSGSNFLLVSCSLQRSKLNYQLDEEVQLHEKELSKAAPLSSPPELIKIDDYLNVRARGKALRSGKRLPDVPDLIFERRGEPYPEEDIPLDNISVSDSEEDDGFNHWSSNEGRCVCACVHACVCVCVCVLA